MEKKKLIMNQIKGFKGLIGTYWSEQADSPLFLNALVVHGLRNFYSPDFSNRYEGPNQRMVLSHKNGISITVWEKQNSPFGDEAIECKIFVNKSFHLNVDMLNEAMQMVGSVWPCKQLFVQFDRRRILLEDLSAFESCGWLRQGSNSDGKEIMIFSRQV